AGPAVSGSGERAEEGDDEERVRQASGRHPAWVARRPSACQQNYLFAGESPQGGAGEVPFVAHLRHAAEHEATKAHRLHALGVSAKDVTARARGRIAQRGGGGAVGAPMRRRGRRPIEAPGSAAPNRSGDGAPRLPAPPSRVTLLRAVPEV